MRILVGKILIVSLGVWILAFRLYAQPAITSQPANQTVFLGGAATFSVVVTGIGPFSYQWRLNGTNLPNNIITTVAGKGVSSHSGDGGAATNAGLSPSFLAIDAAGNVFTTDQKSYRVRKVDTNGIITTVAGNGSYTYSADGNMATNGGLSFPYGIAVDSLGNLFIVEWATSRVRKVNTNGVITTVAGNGVSGFSGDGGQATNASLNSPEGCAVDSIGRLFIMDTMNNRVRMVNTNGIISTVAGKGPNGSGLGSYSGDGGAATNANLRLPRGVTATINNLYIADTDNNRIRKVDTNGIITTVAGNGIGIAGSYSGDGGAATNAGISITLGLALDVAGNLFVADGHNYRVREVDTNGIIATVAGTGTYSYSDDGIAATNAGLGPYDVKLDAAGNLFIADAPSSRIRKVALAGSPTLFLNHVNLINTGNYSVVIISPSGNVTSSVVSMKLQLPPITSVFTASNGLCAFTWGAVSNLTYQLQYATNLIAPTWFDLGSPVTTTNNSVSITNIAGVDGQQFYRVRLWP